MLPRRKQREKRIPVKYLVALSFLAIILVAGITGYYSLSRLFDEWTQDLPSLDNISAASQTQKSLVYASDETTVLAQFQLEKRIPTTLDNVSPLVIRATIDTEDVRFYEHNGIDLFGMGRAALNNITGGELEGASTITQQLVRNTILTQEASEISYKRKVREAKLALDLEKIQSKDEILLLYLNTINYGDGCYGIEAAAQNYFQTSASDLSLSQAATLVGIPQSPNSLNPKEYPEECKERRNVVLSRMREVGDISEEDYQIACNEDLALNPAPDLPIDGIFLYHHFTSYVRDLLLQENNPYDCSYADLFAGGLTIYTSIDPQLQQMAESACQNQCGRMAPELDCALVAIDPTTGYVKAMVGGKDYQTSKVNLATGTGGSGRQAGSTFKAFTLASAIEQGISPQTLIDCTSPFSKNVDGHYYNFENFGGANYGIRTIQSATAISSNTGYLRLSERIGQQASNDMAARLGVKSNLNTVYTTTLGSADVTLLDMTSAYSTLAAGGIKCDPICVVKIVNRDGEVLYEASKNEERVLDEQVTNATTRVLMTVFTGSGTAWNAGLANGQPIAGKTGTSSDFADHWLIGYTPYLCAGTWIGNPAGSIPTDPSLTCNMLWKDFMDQATADKPWQDFIYLPDPPYGNVFNSEQYRKYNPDPKDKKKEDEKEKTENDEEKDDKTSSAPSAVGYSLQDAAVILAGYPAGYLEQYSDTVPAGTVISQSVIDGQVVLVVSLGPQP